MVSLVEEIKKAKAKRVGIAHFNASDSTMVEAIIEAVQELGKDIPVIIGFSESERKFIGSEQAVALIKTYQDEHPVFINADHTKTVESAKEAIDLGFDSVTFDNSHLPLEENIKNIKEVVKYAKGKCLIEGEIGYIGSGSKVLKELPGGVALTEETITKAEEAEDYVKQTEVDFLAPAVGNVHGMLARGKNPNLFINRIKEIFKSTNLPLVLHGASGIPDSDIVPAIEAGISIIHVSTELRKAYKEGLEDMSKDLAPYKFLQEAVDHLKAVVTEKLRLFNKI